MTLSASAYSLGALAFTMVSVKAVHGLGAPAFSLGSPTFSVPTFNQKQSFFTNAYFLQPPDFATPALAKTYTFSANAFSVGALYWAPPHPPFTVRAVFYIDDYWISPSFGYPRLQWQVVDIGIPPSYYTQLEEAATMLTTLLNMLLASISPEINNTTNAARRLVNALRANAAKAIRGDTLGTDLARIYLVVNAAGASYSGI